MTKNKINNLITIRINYANPIKENKERRMKSKSSINVPIINRKCKKMESQVNETRRWNHRLMKLTLSPIKL